MKPKNDPSSPFAGLLADIKDQHRRASIRGAMIAAKKRGVTLDEASMNQEDLDKWGLVATEDEIIAQRETAMREAETGRSRVLAKTKIAPEEFDWVTLTNMALLRKRITGFVEVFAQMREAAERVAMGDLTRVLFVGPAGAGKTSAMVLFPQLVASFWAKDQYDRAVAAISIKPPAEEAVDLYQKHRVLLAEADPGTTSEQGPPARMRHILPPITRGPYERTFAKIWEHEVPIRWATAYDLFRAAKRPQRFGEEEDHLAEFRSARVLLLDDIGGEPVQANLGPVEDVVRARAERTSITISSTGMYDPNVTALDITALLAPLCERYGAAVVRRLAEPGRSVVIPVGLQIRVSALPPHAPPANDATKVVS